MANWLPNKKANNVNNFGTNNNFVDQMHSPQRPPNKCALMNEQQWAQLNEQIKQICLDCSRQFGEQQKEDKEMANSKLVERRPTTIYSAQNQQKPQQIPQKPIIAQQTLQLPPNPKKSIGFSLPRLLLPKGKEKQPRRPSNQDLPEQHSPTTTTSAYGTGGTDTGQESPVEKHQQQQMKSSMGNLGVAVVEQQSRENAKGGRQKSVKFDTSSISLGSKNAVEDIVQLPGGVFYTSAERLAQTLEAQQRLLRKELQEEIPSKMQNKPSQLQRQQPLDKTKRHLIRVPASPLRPIPVPSPSRESPQILHFPPPPPPSNPSILANRASTMMPNPNLIMRNPSAEALSPRPTQKTLLGRPPSLQHVVPPNSPRSMAAAAFGREEEGIQRQPHNFATNIQQNNNKNINFACSTTRGRQMQLKPTLDNIFAYKPPTTMASNLSGNEQQKQGKEQPKVVVFRQFGFAQPRRKSKSPVKQAVASQQQSELEWVIKRRPDGTRYVTRRPARKPKQQCWSAVVKARREQSLLRERYQSGAVSTTTDDDGAATGSEMAHQASRLWMREQRRRHKGRGADAALERSRRECLYGEEWAGMGAGMVQNSSDFGGGQQQILPRLNTDLRLDPQIAGGGGGGPSRGHSLPGQAIFSITTV